jgi:hypothetical protein
MLRTRNLRRLAAALVAGCVLAVPATASADDQSVYNSFHFSHPRFVELRKEFEKAERHWVDSGYSDPGPAYSACYKTRNLAHLVKKRISKKTTSSTLGSKGRNRVLSALDNRRGWADAERLAIRAFMRFDGYNYIRLHRKAKRYIERVQRYEEQARQYFKKAGVKLHPKRK